MKLPTVNPWAVAGVGVAALVLFLLGFAAGNGRDVAPQVDTLIVRSARTDTLISVVARREVVVRAVTDTLQGRIDTLTLTVREALPDSLRPALDSLRGAQEAVVALWRGQSDSWHAVADSLKAERDEGLRLLHLRARKPFPIQIVLGAALASDGRVRPALAIGFRVPLPRLF